jgi:hypothetical protein
LGWGGGLGVGVQGWANKRSLFAGKLDFYFVE